MKTGLPFIGNVLSALIPLGLTSSASATDAAIHKKMFGSSKTTTSNEEVKRYYENSKTT